MKKIFYIGLLLSAVSCGSPQNENNLRNRSEAAKGNSAGSNIIEMDTLHMDTSAHNISNDSAHH